MGPPSGLPDFKELARKIAEPKVPLRREDTASLDRYLGRAAREKVEVQARARQILDNGGSHTPLHENLLGIFGAADKVRLITTNFDRHFAAAAKAVFPASYTRIPQYVGPALPPGQRFRGIAQLHGSLDHPASELVLADSEFADAYMAEGWAVRFLAPVFANRAVLFVGYSLGDPIMRYLLHALRPTKRWYALWHYKDAGRGAEHAISAVTFGKKGQRGDRYRDLNEGMKRWHQYARATPSDHDLELRRLIELGPPASPLDADYVRARLRTPEGRAVFWRTATQESWFAWAASEGLLDVLVQGNSDTAITAGWGNWSLENFCRGETPALLRFLRGRTFVLDSVFRHQLRLFLWRSKPSPPNPVLRQLIALIIGAPGSEIGVRHDWEWLIERMVTEGRFDEALALLRRATELSLQPLERLYRIYEEEEELAELPSLSLRARTLVDPPELVAVLERSGPTFAAAVATQLLALAEQRIDEMYQLLDLARGASGNTNFLSFSRTSIAPSGQDRGAHSEDVLIEIARIALERLASTQSGELGAFVARHETSDRNLLRRLAIYAVAISTMRSPDEVLLRATELGWARDIWVRPELYLVLGAHFAAASKNAQASFVDALRDDKWWGEEFSESEAHARFSLSVKLLREAPNSAAAIAFAEEERTAHPEWRESDEDGFLSRVTVGWGGEEPSPIAADELLAMNPSVAAERLRVALEKETQRHSDRSLLGAVQQAAGMKPAWGVELLTLSMNGDALTSSVAEAVLFGLREVDVAEEQRLSLLRLIGHGEWPDSLARTVGLLLDHWTRSLGKSTSTTLLDAFDEAADVVFEKSRTTLPGIEDHGWTESAINHAAGHAANVWWQVANARDWEGEQFVLTVDDAEKARWERVLADDTAAGAFARPILGMVTHRLSTGDYLWAERVVFPAFDPAGGLDRAAQLWDGRLMQRNWYWSTAEGLRPYVEAMFERSAEFLPARSRELGDFVALLLAGPERPLLSLTQLQEFVQHASDEARGAFADALPRHLQTLEPEARLGLWKHLLKPYWADRRTSMPLALSANELREMISWVEALPEAGPEVVLALRESPMVTLEHADGVLFEWTEDTTWVRAHPAEAAGVVAFLAERRSVDSWMADKALDVLETALSAGAPPQIVLEAAEALVIVAHERAASLVGRIREGRK
jgi:hypothetical protein